MRRVSTQMLLRFLGVQLLALVLLASACSKAVNEGGTQNEKRYSLTGQILGVDQENHTLRVKHDPIEGLMPAMTMEFEVQPGDIANAREGQRIKADLVVAENGDFRLEKIWPDDSVTNAKVTAAAKTLSENTVILGKGAYREIGEKIPEFTLYNQDGQVVPSTQFQGKQVMLNFIFTRCPVATMCPASVARFQQVQRLAKEAGAKDIELISISLDPQYDTPGVLKEYTTQRMIDTSNYTFLTGPETAIKSLLAQFGVLAMFRGDLIEHTLSTVLIDKNGRIIHRVDGSTWEPSEFVEKMEKTPPSS